METTAEGVETHDDLALIRRLGCSHVQGYIYGRPMDLDGVLALIGEGGGRVVARGYQSAREPRRHILRRIEVTSGGYRHDANVRNIASGGALLYGLCILQTGGVLTLDFGGGPRAVAPARRSEGPEERGA